MVFVWKMADKVSHAIGARNPLKKTASCWQQLAFAASMGSGLTVVPVGSELGGASLKAGDIFIMRADGRVDASLIGKAANGHTGIIETDEGITDTTVEGNTSAAGSRNGDRVAERRRSERSILAIIRISSWLQ